MNKMATVHWVVNNENVNSTEDLIKHIYAWNDHKRQFTVRQITLAEELLLQKGWSSNINDGAHA